LTTILTRTNSIVPKLRAATIASSLDNSKISIVIKAPEFPQIVVKTTIYLSWQVNQALALIRKKYPGNLDWRNCQTLSGNSEKHCLFVGSTRLDGEQSMLHKLTCS
jgi:hypothetical protein